MAKRSLQFYGDTDDNDPYYDDCANKSNNKSLSKLLLNSGETMWEKTEAKDYVNSTKHTTKDVEIQLWNKTRLQNERIKDVEDNIMIGQDDDE